MRLFPSLLFGISASLDALLVGISCGLRGIRIRIPQNFAISLVSLLGTCLSAYLGSYLLPFLPLSLAGCTGSIILILFGVYYILKRFFVRPAQDDGAHISDMDVSDMRIIDIDTSDVYAASRDQSDSRNSDMNVNSRAAYSPQESRDLPAHETFFLSLVLSVNNIGIGLSASMAGLPFLPAAAATFACCALFLPGGNRLGQSRLLRLIGDCADPISGLLLIGLGIIQLTL